MSTGLLLKAALNERLRAAAEEIFQMFERTIFKYEEEASSSKQEIERLKSLLESKHKEDFKTSLICKEESRPEQPNCERVSRFSFGKKDQETRHIKEEDHELWDSCQNVDEEQVQEFEDSYVTHSSVSWDENEQDTKPHLQLRTQSSGNEEQFQNLQENKTVPLTLPLTSTSQILIHNERVQDRRENERPATSFAHQSQTDESQIPYITPGEPTELFQMASFTPEYRCFLCDKYFSSNQHLLNHASRMHSSEAENLCAVCGKTLDSTESLTVHLKSHKGSNICHVCGKQYNSKTSLTEHMASHAGVKLHRCHVCGKECSRKGDLKIHMRIHTGEKPFCCSFCCKSFTHSGHLKKHLRSHTGERPHQCNLCGRGFLQSTHLKYHLGTHTQKY